MAIPDDVIADGENSLTAWATQIAVGIGLLSYGWPSGICGQFRLEFFGSLPPAPMAVGLAMRSEHDPKVGFGVGLWRLIDPLVNRLAERRNSVKELVNVCLGLLVEVVSKSNVASNRPALDMRDEVLDVLRHLGPVDCYRGAVLCGGAQAAPLLVCADIKQLFFVRIHDSLSESPNDLKVSDAR